MAILCKKLKKLRRLRGTCYYNSSFATDVIAAMLDDH